jgi:hypothetical protein
VSWPPGCTSAIIWLPSLGLGAYIFYLHYPLYAVGELFLSYLVLNRASIAEAVAFASKAHEAWKGIQGVMNRQLPTMIDGTENKDKEE